MTNEWGPPLTGEEMKALKGRIDPKVRVSPKIGQPHAPYSFWHYSGEGLYHFPANHPYYKVREYNQRHGTNLVLHDGSAKVPEDWDGGDFLMRNGEMLKKGDWTPSWRHDPDFEPEHDIIAYTPKPKESEVTEQMPLDEAIEYVLNLIGSTCSVEDVKLCAYPNLRAYNELARLIQQYEPDRLKPAVDVAAEEWATSEGMFNPDYFNAFKAGAAWRLQHPTA